MWTRRPSSIGEAFRLLFILVEEKAPLIRTGGLGTWSLWFKKKKKEFIKTFKTLQGTRDHFPRFMLPRWLALAFPCLRNKHQFCDWDHTIHITLQRAFFLHWAPDSLAYQFIRHVCVFRVAAQCFTAQTYVIDSADSLIDGHLSCFRFSWPQKAPVEPLHTSLTYGLSC